MKNKIDRTLLWFQNGQEKLLHLEEAYFGLSTLLNRLLNEFYEGKKIKFINIFLATKEKYLKYPAVPMNYTHYYGGHLNYYGIFDSDVFNKFENREQSKYVWDRARECLNGAAKSIKNEELLKANECAYRRGIELKLNPDYRVIENNIYFEGQELRASVWIHFREDGMYSKFTLENQSKIVFEKDIDKTKKGVEFFLDMYKNIELNDNKIVIKGVKEAISLPLEISLEEANLG